MSEEIVDAEIDRDSKLPALAILAAIFALSLATLSVKLGFGKTLPEPTYPPPQTAVAYLTGFATLSLFGDYLGGTCLGFKLRVSALSRAWEVA